MRKITKRPRIKGHGPMQRTLVSSTRRRVLVLLMQLNN